MRTPLLILSLSFIFFVNGITGFSQNGDLTIVDIKKGLEDPWDWLSSQSVHNYRDVEILVLDTPYQGYLFVVYGMKNDSIKAYSDFIYDIKDDFNKVGYLWESDTSIYIKLFKPEIENTLEFRLTGDIIRELGTNSSRLSVLENNSVKK